MTIIIIAIITFLALVWYGNKIENKKEKDANENQHEIEIEIKFEVEQEDKNSRKTRASSINRKTIGVHFFNNSRECINGEWRDMNELREYLKTGELSDVSSYAFYVNDQTIEVGDVLTGVTSYDGDYSTCIVVELEPFYEGRKKTLKYKEKKIRLNDGLILKSRLPIAQELLSQPWTYLKDVQFAMGENYPDIKAAILNSGGKVTQITKNVKYLIESNPKESYKKGTIERYKEKYGVDIKIIDFDQFYKLAKTGQID